MTKTPSIAWCFLFSGSLKPLQNPHLWHISARCVSQTLAYLYDMSARFAILSL
ncbi:hypothetical protein [Wielerella bovis]|uniref:hypothetical protein n=1 Tax=Wielerella bovis TaxID=2917790 RepID=UPI002018E456|nr:hypothetical protein [Wielerella bovis]MCG7657408.1 hypothetical protein [Wielerella bovis]MCG7659629.1 hypothetical protein [Wielerella bovis]ULJ59582.1 hypothetical protein MIS44_07740 [Wielerella bovis]ULJ61816.1 hypothetical protein MIS46_07360 [Wielerella bovis]